MVGKPDLVLASIRRYSGYADKSIPEIPITTLDSKSLEKYLALSDEKSRLEKRKKEIDAEQRAISVPFVELMGQGCKAFLEDGTNRYKITFNPTRRTMIGKENLEKAENAASGYFQRVCYRNRKPDLPVKEEAAVMLKGKRAYICSPLSAKTREERMFNMGLAKAYLDTVSQVFHCRTYASHAYLPLMLDDTIQRNGSWRFPLGKQLLDFCDVLIICGGRISSGMEGEIRYAHDTEKEVVLARRRPGSVFSYGR